MKTRLTITLSASTLKKVDRLIDGTHVRNRSHAIESVLEKNLRSAVGTAVILAGGQENTPESFRPLQLLDGKPLIIYTVEQLKKNGVSRLIIATNTYGKKIGDVLGNGSSWDMEILYHFEEKPRGTAGAIKAVAKLLPDEPFVVWAGDVLSTINLEEMAMFHEQYGALVTMAVKPRLTKTSYDNVFIQGHTVVDFESSKPDQAVSIVNTGIYVLERKAIEFIPDTPNSMLEKDVFPKLSRSHKLLAFTFQGIWFDITSDGNYQEAVKQLRTGG